MRHRKVKRDVKLFIFASVIAIALFLLDKTPATVTVCLAAIFILLATIVWDVFSKYIHRWIALIVLAGSVSVFGIFIWPIDKLAIETCPHRLSFSRSEHGNFAQITIHKTLFGKAMTYVTVYTRWPIFPVKVDYPPSVTAAGNGHMRNGLAFSDFEIKPANSTLTITIPIEADVVCVDQRF